MYKALCFLGYHAHNNLQIIFIDVKQEYKWKGERNG